MAKVTVEFEVDTQHVGRGYFERLLEMQIEKDDAHGCAQIRVSSIKAPEGWR